MSRNGEFDLKCPENKYGSWVTWEIHGEKTRQTTMVFMIKSHDTNNGNNNNSDTLNQKGNNTNNYGNNSFDTNIY